MPAYAYLRDPARQERLPSHYEQARSVAYYLVEEDFELGSPVAVGDPASARHVPFAERLAGSQLLALLSAGDALVCHSLQVLAPSTAALLPIVENLLARGIVLHFTSVRSYHDPRPMPLRTDSSAGEFFLPMLRLAASFIKERPRDSVRESLASLKARGLRHTRQAGIGCRWAWRGPYQVRVPDEEQRKIIAGLTDRWLAGETLDRLYWDGQRNGPGWSRSRIHRAIRWELSRAGVTNLIQRQRPTSKAAARSRPASRVPPSKNSNS